MQRKAEPSVAGLRAAMFDLSQLRCFVILAEELHFGRAAQRLNMTQPPLSRHIQVLEHNVGTKLLERTSRQVRLTVAGRTFLPEARRILKMSLNAAEVARRIAHGKAGSISIGFTATAGYSFLPELIQHCASLLPDVDLSLREMVSSDQMEGLDNGQIDVGLLRPPIVRPGYASCLVATESLLAAVGEDHPFAGHDSLSLKDFDRMPLIMYSPLEARYFHDLLASQFFQNGVLPRYVQHLSQIHTMLSLVRSGLGLAIVPQSAAALRFAGVRHVPIRNLPDDLVQLYMVWRKESDNPLLGQFIAAASKGYNVIA